ncbi:uncharacterized protein JCM10292_005979 [Rhodotorula paludigena]|uniref:uncharacterized protein n=1 Tax=Rhodotorula paludigena TaxID=86838 RepID=UPI00316B8331
MKPISLLLSSLACLCAVYAAPVADFAGAAVGVDVDAATKAAVADISYKELCFLEFTYDAESAVLKYTKDQLIKDEDGKDVVLNDGFKRDEKDREVYYVSYCYKQNEAHGKTSENSYGTSSTTGDPFLDVVDKLGIQSSAGFGGHSGVLANLVSGGRGFDSTAMSLRHRRQFGSVGSGLSSPFDSSIPFGAYDSSPFDSPLSSNALPDVSTDPNELLEGASAGFPGSGGRNFGQLGESNGGFGAAGGAGGGLFGNRDSPSPSSSSAIPSVYRWKDSTVSEERLYSDSRQTPRPSIRPAPASPAPQPSSVASRLAAPPSQPTSTFQPAAGPPAVTLKVGFTPTGVASAAQQGEASSLTIQTVPPTAVAIAS